MILLDAPYRVLMLKSELTPKLALIFGPVLLDLILANRLFDEGRPPPIPDVIAPLTDIDISMVSLLASFILIFKLILEELITGALLLLNLLLASLMELLLDIPLPNLGAIAEGL